jgi:hypothetical protein
MGNPIMSKEKSEMSFSAYFYSCRELKNQENQKTLVPVSNFFVVIFPE